MVLPQEAGFELITQPDPFPHNFPALEISACLLEDEVFVQKKFENVLVIESMIGNRLGEFAKTRTFLGHAKKGKISKVYGGSGRVE